MTRSPDCIFCKIAVGEIPSSRVWESPDAIAFLDINPLSHGHTLLVPRAHATDLRDIAPDVLSRMMAVAPRIADAVMSATRAEGLNFLQNSGAVAGQAVMHVHFHFIPRHENDGLGYRWNAGSYPPGRMNELHSQIRSKLA